MPRSVRKVIFARVHNEHHLCYYGIELIADIKRCEEGYWNIEFVEGGEASGFITVKGFQRYLEQWVRRNK